MSYVRRGANEQGRKRGVPPLVYTHARACESERTKMRAPTMGPHTRATHTPDTADGTQPTQALANKLSQPQARLEYYRED